MQRSYTSFQEIQHDLKKGLLSCIDLIEGHLANIETNKHLNAFLSVYADEARSRAVIIDHKIKKGQAGKLAGLVVGIKDVLAYQYHPLQSASKILEEYSAPYSSTVVQRLLDEDAIIIGRQNCDEFAMGSSNENSAYGVVRNAIDPSRVPGGSSGGSAVAVMANMCQVSIGSDTGGSVRQPAAFCGVLGLKPTYSRISRYGLVAYASSFDCVGIFSKSVTDIAQVLEVIAGSDDFDSTVSKQEVPAYSSSVQKEIEQSFRIAYLRETLESTALQPEIREAISGKLNQLKEQGHQVEPIDFPLNEYVLPTYYILATAEASSNLSRYDGVRYGYRSPQTTDLTSMYKKTRAEAFGKEVQRRILLGTFVLSASYYDAYYLKAQKVRRLIREGMKEFFKKYDFVLMPTTPTTAFKIGEHSANPVEMYLADLFSVQANVAGLPAISVPCGIDQQGLPIGLQIMADDFEEEKLLQFTHHIT